MQMPMVSIHGFFLFLHERYLYKKVVLVIKKLCFFFCNQERRKQMTFHCSTKNFLIKIFLLTSNIKGWFSVAHALLDR